MAAVLYWILYLIIAAICFVGAIETEDYLMKFVLVAGGVFSVAVAGLYAPCSEAVRIIEES